VGFPTNNQRYIEQQGIYMLAPKLYYTAGHAEIQAFEESASPQFSSEAVLDELGTYQLITKYEVNEPLMEKWGSLVYSAVRFHPTSEECGFSHSCFIKPL